MREGGAAAVDEHGAADEVAWSIYTVRAVESELDRHAPARGPVAAPRPPSAAFSWVLASATYIF